jgi:hypothetical protein
VGGRFSHFGRFAHDAYVAGSVEREIDALYELAPEDFTAARDRLAKDLKIRGDPEGAVRVKGLRRPTLAAWAVNQVVRADPDGADALLKAGDELRKAQRRALSGVSGGGLRQAAEHRRKVLRGLLKVGEEILREAGRASAGTLEAIQATFEAASTDEDAGRLVKEGRLAKELPPPAGFGTVEGLALVPPPAETARAQDRAETARSKRAPDERKRQAARLADLRTERDAARKQAQSSEREAKTARKDAQSASSSAVKAQEEAERARQAAEEARLRARDLATRAREAAAEAARAEREAERARLALEQAEKELAAGRR